MFTHVPNYPQIEKIETGITGFDLISAGGLPKGRTTLVSGTAGSAKTVFAVQFLAEGIQRSNEAGIFVTFEESTTSTLTLTPLVPLKPNTRGLVTDCALPINTLDALK